MVKTVACVAAAIEAGLQNEVRMTPPSTGPDHSLAPANRTLTRKPPQGEGEHVSDVADKNHAGVWRWRPGEASNIRHIRHHKSEKSESTPSRRGRPRKQVNGMLVMGSISKRY